MRNPARNVRGTITARAGRLAQQWIWSAYLMPCSTTYERPGTLEKAPQSYCAHCQHVSALMHIERLKCRLQRPCTGFAVSAPLAVRLRYQWLCPDREPVSSQPPPLNGLRDLDRQNWCLPAAVLNPQLSPVQLRRLPAAAMRPRQLTAWRLKQLVEPPQLMEVQTCVSPERLRFQLLAAAALIA